MPTMAYWTSLPIRNELWLCRRTEIGIEPVRAIPRPLPNEREPRSPMAISDEGWTAFVQGTEVVVLPPQPDAAPTHPVLPDDVESVGALTFHDDLLYVGCGSSWQDSSRLGWCMIGDPQPQWNPLPAPNIVGDPKRPIYAILASYDRLIALDGAFTPKLAVTYDVSDPRAPRYLDHVSIPSGIDDEPVDAAVGRSYVAILTRARHDRGKAWKIGIFDFDTMDEIATFYQHAEHHEQMEMPIAITMFEDLLLIAHDMKGVGVVRLDDRRDTRFTQVSAITPWAQSYVPLERVEYHLPLGQGHVLDVQPTGDPHCFAITVRRGGRSWWEEIVLT